MSKVDDTTLLQWIASGKQEENDRAFSYLYRDYYDLIEKVVIANSGKPADAEDIFQDALIVLFHQVKKGNFTLTSSLKTYLYSICRNLWLKKLRHLNRVVTLSDTLQQYVNIEESHFKTLEVNEEKVMIARFLEQLGQGCREILVYFYFDRLKMAEIAQRMNLSGEQVAKNKKSGCLKKLKDLISRSSYFKEK